MWREREEKWEHREIGYLILQPISLLDALVVALLRSLPCVSTRITAPTTTFMEQENKMMKVLVWFTVKSKDMLMKSNLYSTRFLPILAYTPGHVVHTT